MRVARVLGCVAGLVASQAMAQGLAFKDLVIDGSLEEARKVRPLECSPPKSHPADLVCALSPRVKETIAGVPVRMLLLFSYADAIDTISLTIAEADFRTVLAALGERYGVPTKFDKSSVTNRMGASFEQIEAEWESVHGRIAVRRYGSSLDVSSIYFSSPKTKERFAEQRRQRTQERAKDL